MFVIQIQVMLCSVINKPIGETEMTIQNTGKEAIAADYWLVAFTASK